MNTRLVINFLLFQLGWFACVLGAAANLPWTGSLLVIGIIGYHLYRAVDSQAELHLLLLVLLIGFTWDSLLVTLGILEFSSGVFHSTLAPHWIMAMWALFSSTLNVSMSWLKGRYLLASVFGFVGGPMAYYAGLKLGAVLMPSTLQALVVLSIGWAIIMPLLVFLSERFNGVTGNRMISDTGKEVSHV
jgi:hypothetical protein